MTSNILYTVPCTMTWDSKYVVLISVEAETDMGKDINIFVLVGPLSMPHVN